MFLRIKLFNTLKILTIYLILIILIYYCHSQYFRVDVVFYSAMFDALLASFLILILLKYGNNSKIFNLFEKTLLFIMCLLLGYSISISIPTVIDRSLSFYMLEKLEQRGGGILISRFEDVFTIEYAKEHRLVDVRLTEQIRSGTIVIDDGCVKLTERGKAFVSFSRFFRKYLLPKQRLLMGTYSDDLTHLFSTIPETNSYQCN